MGLTREIAEFVSSSGSGSIPPAEIATAQRAVIDCLAAALAGSRSEAGRIMLQSLRERDEIPRSTVIGGGFQTSVPSAALANGVMAHVMDYDDSHLPFRGHPSAVLVPVVLAVGEWLGSSGRDVLTAYVLGFEIGSRTSAAILPHHYEIGWHTTGTVGIIRATVSAGWLCRLNRDQLRNALGIATSLTAGVRRNFGTMTKSFHAGNAARNGIIAAFLAREGFSADPDVYEARYGFLSLFKGLRDWDENLLTAELGRRYEITHPGLWVKAYPSAGASHSCIDAVLHLKETHRIEPTDIQGIRCGINRHVAEMVLIHHRPKTPLEGKFSLEYCVAAALLYGRLGLDEFTSAKMEDPRVQDLIGRVKTYLPEMVDPLDRGAEVEITLKNGTRYTHQVKNRKGSPEHPLSDRELEEKFVDCAREELDRESRRRVLDLLWALPKLDHINALLDVLRTGKRNEKWS